MGHATGIIKAERLQASIANVNVRKLILCVHRIHETKTTTLVSNNIHSTGIK